MQLVEMAVYYHPGTVEYLSQCALDEGFMGIFLFLYQHSLIRLPIAINYVLSRQGCLGRSEADIFEVCLVADL